MQWLDKEIAMMLLSAVVSFCNIVYANVCLVKTLKTGMMAL